MYIAETLTDVKIQKSVHVSFGEATFPALSRFSCSFEEEFHGQSGSGTNGGCNVDVGNVIGDALDIDVSEFGGENHINENHNNLQNV